MSDTIFVFGGHAVTVLEIAIGAVALVVMLLLGLLRSVSHHARNSAEDAGVQAAHARELEERLLQLARLQSETSGRVQVMADVLTQRQNELSRAVAERLDATSHRVGETIARAGEATHENLVKLNERLALIDQARQSLGELSSQVVSLRETLANKQARGAFGEGRLQAIVADGLPRDSFAFQYTLPNGKRADCAIFLPGDLRPLLVDSKFPLEALTAVREAGGPEARKHAEARLRQDVGRHIADIAERYVVAGDTQDVALMFVPSEAVYAELHGRFDDMIQRAFRARVILVSPSLLMLAVQVVQSIAKDARMREQADLLRAECGALVADVVRLRDRVGNLQRHFSQASEDVAQALISADKVARRGERIEQLEFTDTVRSSDAAQGRLGDAAE